MIVKSLSIAALLALGLSGAAIAQGNSGNQGGGGNNGNAEGLVNVLVGDVVLQEILSGNTVQVEAPITVQVPIGVAANVCDVSANVLAQQADDAAPCEAKSTSQALNKIVLEQVASQ